MNLPASFIDYTRSLLGDEEYDKLAAALQQEPPVSIRLNKLRMDSQLLPVPWSSEGFISMSVLLLRSILCFMQAAIMFRKPLPCL